MIQYKYDLILIQFNVAHLTLFQKFGLETINDLILYINQMILEQCITNFDSFESIIVLMGHVKTNKSLFGNCKLKDINESGYLILANAFHPEFQKSFIDDMYCEIKANIITLVRDVASKITTQFALSDDNVYYYHKNTINNIIARVQNYEGSFANKTACYIVNHLWSSVQSLMLPLQLSSDQKLFKRFFEQNFLSYYNPDLSIDIITQYDNTCSLNDVKYNTDDEKMEENINCINNATKDEMNMLFEIELMKNLQDNLFHFHDKYKITRISAIAKSSQHGYDKILQYFQEVRNNGQYKCDSYHVINKLLIEGSTKNILFDRVAIPPFKHKQFKIKICKRFCRIQNPVVKNNLLNRKNHGLRRIKKNHYMFNVRNESMTNGTMFRTDQTIDRTCQLFYRNLDTTLWTLNGQMLLNPMWNHSVRVDSNIYHAQKLLQFHALITFLTACQNDQAFKQKSMHCAIRAQIMDQKANLTCHSKVIKNHLKQNPNDPNKRSLKQNVRDNEMMIHFYNNLIQLFETATMYNFQLEKHDPQNMQSCEFTTIVYKEKIPVTKNLYTYSLNITNE